jgi:ligand-binding sensor domain-containing protein
MRVLLKMVGIIISLLPILPPTLSAQDKILTGYERLAIAEDLPDIKFERISIEHGLSQSSIRCIFQDRKGFMWFGTADGLNKYDGYKFTIYKPEFDNPNSLSHNVINSIYEDRSGGLWIGTDGGGLNKFNREKETFARYQHDPNNPYSLRNNYVTSIHEGRSGVLWIGTRGGGLNKLVLSKAEGSDREKEIFSHYQHHPNNPNSLSNNNVSSIYEDPDEPGVLWIGTAGGGINKLILPASVLSGSKAKGSNQEKENDIGQIAEGKEHSAKGVVVKAINEPFSL